MEEVLIMVGRSPSLSMYLSFIYGILNVNKTNNFFLFYLAAGFFPFSYKKQQIVGFKGNLDRDSKMRTSCCASCLIVLA